MTTRGMGFLLLIGLIAGGCGGGTKEEPTFGVSGTVTLDGQPLPEGEIYFLTTATGQIDILPITGGKFSGQAKSGPKRVEIRAYKMETPPAPADMPGYQMEPTKVNYLPAEYNSESTLTAEVAEGKTNEFTFDVKTK